MLVFFRTDMFEYYMSVGQRFVLETVKESPELKHIIELSDMLMTG